jgi:protein TonB
MNLQKEQQDLIEYLEDALAEARLHPPSERRNVDEIENELQEALQEYKRVSEKGQSPEAETEYSTPSAIPASTNPCPSLLIWRERRLEAFLSNLQTLWSRRPSKIKLRQVSPELDLFYNSSKWLGRVWNNARIVFHRSPAKPIDRNGEATQTRFLFNETSWKESLFSNLKVLFVKPKSGTLATSAEPVETVGLLKEYRIHWSSFLISMLLHVVILGSSLVIPLLFLQEAPDIQFKVTEISLQFPTDEKKKPLLHLPPAVDEAGGGGGGGRREPTPASLGRLPRSSDRQLTPPVPKVANLDPILSVEPTIVAPPLAQLPTVNLPYYGDPFGAPGPPSSGPGSGGGIGSGRGGGVGPGSGPGVGPGEGGGIGGGVYRIGGGVSAPVVIYRVEPLYSEEARKAKYQGTVVFSAIVRKNGTLDILKVLRGIGLGLDENAVQALRQWKFRPGMKNGAPVDVYLNVEVNFSLR